MIGHPHRSNMYTTYAENGDLCTRITLLSEFTGVRVFSRNNFSQYVITADRTTAETPQVCSFYTIARGKIRQIMPSTIETSQAYSFGTITRGKIR